MPWFFWDGGYLLLVVPVLLLTLLAQVWVNATFRRYSGVVLRCRWTGADGARAVLSRGGATQVRIAPVGGSLTDHYDPRNETIYLSEPVYAKSSVAAVGVAAHEAGHALQHQEGYLPLRIRTAMVPVTNFCSRWSVPLIILGLLLGFTQLAAFGVLIFSVTTLFQLVTLPVEFNASRRALASLTASGNLAEEEVRAASRVLRAAAFTYVAALATSFAYLFYYVSRINGRRR